MQNISNKTIAAALNNPNFSFIETFADATDSSKITKEMTILIFKNRSKRQELQVRDRERIVLENTLNKKKRKSYLKHENVKPEKKKQILVEIETEEEQYELNLIEHSVKELTRELSAIKVEIDTWKAISYNLRTEMGSF